MRIIIEDSGKELGVFTLCEKYAKAVLEGELINFRFGRYDGVSFPYGIFEISPDIEGLSTKIVDALPRDITCMTEHRGKIYIASGNKIFCKAENDEDFKQVLFTVLEEKEMS